MNPKPIHHVRTALAVFRPIIRRLLFRTLLVISLAFIPANAEVVANYRSDFKATTPKAGWTYSWNHPAYWMNAHQSPWHTTNSLHGKFPGYNNLVWTGSNYTPDGDTNYNNNTPAGHLRLGSTGGHPGVGGESITTVSGAQDRHAIASFAVPAAGFYKLSNAWIRRSNSGGNGNTIEVMGPHGGTLLQGLVEGTATYDFGCYLGWMNAGQRLYVAVGPNGNSGWDGFEWDFSVETYLPTAMTKFSTAVAANTPPEGWRFAWNAPDGWSPGVAGNLSTGAVSNIDSWRDLTRSSGLWIPEPGNTPAAPPVRYLRLGSGGGIPGSGGSSRELDRHAISVFRVNQPGSYQLGMAWIKVSGGGNGVELRIYAAGVLKKTLVVPANGLARFETRLGHLKLNDEIAVAVGPNGDVAYDNFQMDYQVALATPSFDGRPVFNVAGYGAAGNGNTDDFVAINNAVSAAAAAGGGIVRFDGSKIYRVIGPGSGIESVLNLSNRKNIKIEGNGATLLLHPPDRLAYIDNAENIQIDGLTVDYAPLPYFQGNITAINAANRTVDVQVPTRYPVPTVGAGNWVFGRTFYPKSVGSRSGGGKHLWIDSVTALDGTGRKLRITEKQNVNPSAVQDAVNNGATEVVIPTLNMGHKGNFATRLHRSSRVTISNVTFLCVPEFVINPADNFGPVTFHNVDVLTPEPATELFVSWRDCYHVKDNRFGIHISEGDWDGGAMYDDLFNLSTVMANVTAHSGTSISVHRSGGGSHTWKAGDWVTVWDKWQNVRRGSARITSPASVSANNFTLTLESVIPGVAFDDTVINEELLNRDTLVENCRTTGIGSGRGSGRIRTPVLFKNCNFLNTYWWVYSQNVGEGPRPANIVFDACTIEGGAKPFDVDHVLNFTLKNSVINNGRVHVFRGSKNVRLENVSWINQTGTILQAANASGPIHLFGGSKVNGSTNNLSNWVTKDAASSIFYAAP